MSDRRIETSLQVPLPARARIDAGFEGVSTEMSDRRAISIFAMFALDEPEEAATVTGSDGIVAFLPEFCRPR